jgi:hypothetical protein
MKSQQINKRRAAQVGLKASNKGDEETATAQ